MPGKGFLVPAICCGWDHWGGRCNLLPLCTAHHHLIHDGGWHLALHPDRTITLHRPDGTTTFSGSTIDATPAGPSTHTTAA